MGEINNVNNKGRHNGYQEWHIFNYDYTITNKDKVWFRGNVKNGQKIGYIEINLEDNNYVGQKGTTLNFYII